MNDADGNNTHGLTPLGYKILLDRYAQNDPNAKENLKVGDIAIAIIDNDSKDTKQRREVGTVLEISDGGMVKIEHLETKEIYELPIALIDRPLETTPAEIQARVAKGIASVEKTDALKEQWEKEFQWAMDDWKFVPGGRILTAAGTDQDLSAFNCFLIPNPPDARGGIIKSLGTMAEIMSRGGGVGMNISALRPKNSYVAGVNGRSSGSVSWGALFSYTCGLIEQSGCLTGETRIATNDSSLGSTSLIHMIENHEAGEVVTVLTPAGSKRVTDVFHNGKKPVYLMVTLEGRAIRATANHPFELHYGESGEKDMIPLEKLKVGDKISTLGFGKGHLRDEIIYIGLHGEEETYDITVEDIHAFYANNIYCGNSRRGALILILNDWHPDVFDFINSKREAGKIENANISVGISDTFMEAVKADADWDLKFPDTSHPDYDDKWDGDLEEWEAEGLPVVVHRTVKAKEIWDAIVDGAWASAEPGLWFRERSNKMSNSFYYEKGKLVGTNPCITGDTLVSIEGGHKRADKLEVGDIIKTPKGFHPIKRIDRNGIKPIWEIEFSDGGSLSATGDHGLWVKNNQDISRPDKGIPNWTDEGQWVTVENLVVGDAVGTDGNNDAIVTSVALTDREEEVYDVFEPNTLTWITNGYVSLDCGEIPLPGNGVCNLASINLSKFWNSEKQEVNWQELAVIARVGVRFLDNVIDWTPYHFQENFDQQKSERRIGLGIMGLHELMIRAGIRYGSPEGVEFTDRIFKHIARNAYLASAILAEEKGAFPLYSEELLESGYMQQWKETENSHVHGIVKSQGLRNVTLLTCAPNGSIGTMVNTSTGIEPFFSWQWYRQGRLGMHEETIAFVDEYMKENGIDSYDALPDYFVTAMDLSPMEHANIQAAAQKWVDQSISKTVNAPNDYTVEQVSELYMYMYDMGCKGGTIYRDGSRSEQVLTVKKDDNATINEIKETSVDENTKERIQRMSDIVLDMTSEEFDEWLEGDEDDLWELRTEVLIHKRPQKMMGMTFEGDTPFGTVYITINEDPTGVPFEVFITIGKSGSDLLASAESLGRIISRSLQVLPVLQRLSMLETQIRQLIGIGGSRQHGFGAKRVSSLQDAIGKLIDKHYLNPKSAMEIAIEEIEGEPPANEWTTTMFTIEDTDLILQTGKVDIVEHDDAPVREISVIRGANMCPECGEITLIETDGCRKCVACGYSEC